MTFAEAMVIMQSRLRRYKDADTNISASVLKLELNLARSKFFNDTDFTERIKQLNTVATQRELRLGNDVNHIIKLYINTAEERKEIIEISTMDLPIDRTTAGEPECFYIVNDNTTDGPEIGFYPIPDIVYQVDLHFKLDPTRALTDTDDIMIDDKYISGVMDFALSNLVRSRLVARELKSSYDEVVMTAKGDADGSRASTRDTAFWDPRFDEETVTRFDYGKRRRLRC